MLAVILLSLLFGAANSVLSYSRRETEKGFWIQQGITQLRNGSRAITDLLKKTSYPTTITRDSVVGEKVISFHEKREYDLSGRLRKMDVNASTDFDMHSISDGDMIKPSFIEQTIMYFPVCEPEKDLETGYTAGVINWVELLLKPSHNYSETGLGTLVIIEREKTYDTRSETVNRAFGLSGAFDRGLPTSRVREIINDVNAIQVDSYEIDELRGLVVTTDGAPPLPVVNKKILVSINISVSHPKDAKIWLSDQCSVINNVQLVKVAGGGMELLQVISASSAKLKYNGTEKNVSVGGTIGPYMVTQIIDANSIAMKELGSDLEQILYKRDD